MTRDDKVNLALSLAGIGGTLPTWTWDGDTWVPSRPEGLSEAAYSRAVAMVRAELARVRRRKRSIASILTDINALTNQQKATLRDAAIARAASDEVPDLIRMLGANVWVFDGNATVQTRYVALMLREDPKFARSVNIELDGDEPEE